MGADRLGVLGEHGRVAEFSLTINQAGQLIA